MRRPSPLRSPGVENHSDNLHAPNCEISDSDSVDVARYVAFTRTRYFTACDAHLIESIFYPRTKAPPLLATQESRTFLESVAFFDGAMDAKVLVVRGCADCVSVGLYYNRHSVEQVIKEEYRIEPEALHYEDVEQIACPERGVSEGRKTGFATLSAFSPQNSPLEKCRTEFHKKHAPTTHTSAYRNKKNKQ